VEITTLCGLGEILASEVRRIDIGRLNEVDISASLQLMVQTVYKMSALPKAVIR
jgi:hypothetical protein